MGWERYDTTAALLAMNDLYRNELRLWMNLYQPSVKLAETRRRGSRLKRRYEAPKTPLDRLAEFYGGDKPRAVAELLSLRSSLDPFALSEAVEKKLEKAWKCARRASWPAAQKGSFREIKENTRESAVSLRSLRSLRLAAEDSMNLTGAFGKILR